MELKIGYMSNEELSRWFGINSHSFFDEKRKKLNELSQYCDFIEVYGGINIIKIYNDKDKVYIQKNSKTYKKIKENFRKDWSENGLDSCKNISNKVFTRLRVNIDPVTIYNYVVRIRDELYGKPLLNKGTLGKSEYVFCKKRNREQLIPFNAEEQKIKKQLLIKYFKTIDEREIIIHNMQSRGEITKEEAYDALCQLREYNKDRYIDFIEEFEKNIGDIVTIGTQLYENDLKTLKKKNEEEKIIEFYEY